MGRLTFQKRQKEMKRQEKRQMKAEKRAQRKLEKAAVGTALQNESASEMQQPEETGVTDHAV